MCDRSLRWHAGQHGIEIIGGIFAGPEGRAKLVKAFNKKGEVRDLEINLQGKNGRIMTLLLSGEIIALNGKKCILTTSNDITQRKRAEERIGADLAAMTRLRRPSFRVTVCW